MEVKDYDKEDSEEEFEEAEEGYEEVEDEIEEAEVDYREELMCAIEFIRREKKKNKKLQEELDNKKDTRELEKMITKLKVQIEYDKRIEEALKEQLEEKDKITGNLEAEIVTLRKDIQKKNMQNSSKVLDVIINSQKSHLDKSGLRYNQTEKGSAPKQPIKKQIQKDMQKQSKGIGTYTRKITGSLVHREDSDFRINNRQIGLKKKQDS
jgi:hypothetical protein